MTVNLSIKGVSQALAEALRERAARHHRSLQGELMAIVEAAVRDEAPSPAHARAFAPQEEAPRQTGLPPSRHGARRLEDIGEAHQQTFPRAITQGPRSVDIVRELRDQR